MSLITSGLGFTVAGAFTPSLHEAVGRGEEAALD